MKHDGLLLPERRLWSREEYDRMTEAGMFEGERLELIEGEIVRKMPQKSLHATAVRRAESRMNSVFSAGYDVRCQLPLALGDRSEPEPDVAVVTGTMDDYVNQHPRTATLVIEVADTSLEVDRSTKASLYAMAGIQEYWIVNLVDRLLEVYREPSLDPEQPLGHRYNSVTVLKPEQTVSPSSAPNTRIEVADFLPPASI